MQFFAARESGKSPVYYARLDGLMIGTFAKIGNHWKCWPMWENEITARDRKEIELYFYQNAEKLLNGIYERAAQFQEVTTQISDIADNGQQPQETEAEYILRKSAIAQFSRDVAKAVTRKGIAIPAALKELESGRKHQYPDCIQNGINRVLGEFPHKPSAIYQVIAEKI